MAPGFKIIRWFCAARNTVNRLKGGLKGGLNSHVMSFWLEMQVAYLVLTDGWCQSTVCIMLCNTNCVIPG